MMRAGSSEGCVVGSDVSATSAVAAGYGYGYGFAVRADDDMAGSLTGA
ncbi:hypothetical protein VDGD_20767 [Verticillium dahliae]|nr:hypothetical protein VDGD_20767 [Verticillium dahliae]